MEAKMKTFVLCRREFWLKSLSIIGYFYVSNDNDDGVLPSSEHRCKTTLTKYDLVE